MTTALAIVPREPRYTLLSGHPASDHQAAIFDALADPRSGSKLITAVAGSGKTTTLKNGLRHVPAGSHVQGLAFGKDAARNLKEALAELIEADGPERYRNVRMGTGHSVCYRAVAKFLAIKELKPDSGKLRRILKAKLQGDDHELYAAFAARLVGYAKNEGIGALVADEEWRWYELVDHHAMYLDREDAELPRAVEVARKALAYSTKVAHNGDVDFDDLPYLVIAWKLRLWQNDMVLLDESQDTNPVGRAIVRLLLKKNGRLFAVGDHMQAIYGFRGASGDAMDLIRREFNCTELPLTVSYRCAQAIVRHVQGWVPYMEPAETADDGEVQYDVPFDDALETLTAEDAILCRQNAPLVGKAYRLIADGRGCRVLGREIGEGLIDLIESMRAKGVDRLVEKLDAFRRRESTRLVAKGQETAAEAVEDRVECVMTCVRALPETERTVPALMRRIGALFDDKADGVLTLASVHKSKGLEWPTVAILRPDLMPSRAARQEWQEEEEIHVQVVAATRAKQLLMYLEVEE